MLRVVGLGGHIACCGVVCTKFALGFNVLGIIV